MTSAQIKYFENWEPSWEQQKESGDDYIRVIGGYLWTSNMDKDKEAQLKKNGWQIRPISELIGVDLEIKENNE